MGILKKSVLAAVLALTVALMAAPLAAAQAAPVRVTVRVEAAPYQLAPETPVNVPANGYFADSLGNFYSSGQPTAMSALGQASISRGFTFATSFQGAMVTNIGGFGALADWSQGWTYFVNGWGPDVGAKDLRVITGDSIVFSQTPDNTWPPRTAYLLVVRLSGRVLEPGATLTVTVVGDDTSKPDSQADAKRFRLSSSTVQTSAQFAPMTAATVHIGSEVYTTDGSGTVTIPAIPIGRYAVYAEKAMDSSVYFRSGRQTVAVYPPPRLHGVVARPNPFRPRLDRVRVLFTLTQNASLRLVVKNRAGRVVATVRRSFMSSSRTQAVYWNGRDAAGHPVARGIYTLRLVATDPFGRIVSATTTVTAR
jgi:hypothetical protein